MKKRFLGLVLMVLTLSSFGQTIAITEINYNSDPYNKSNDWVELHNYGGSAVDISNWKLKDETPFNSFTIPAGTVLDANEYVVLVENIDTFLMVHGGVTNYIGEFAFGFDNTFGTVKIENNSGTVIKAVPYIDSIPWPKVAMATVQHYKLLMKKQVKVILPTGVQVVC